MAIVQEARKLQVDQLQKTAEAIGVYCGNRVAEIIAPLIRALSR